MSLKLTDIKCRVNSDFEIDIPFLEVKSNETLGILGASGSGKSSLLNIIVGFSEHTGEIKLNNINIQDFPVSDRKLAYIIQEPSLFESKPIGDNITFSSTQLEKKEKVKLFNSLCDKVGLNKDYNQTIKSLSGGEKQRVNIARSLASQPSFFMFDEAFNQLDNHTKIELHQKLKNILKQGNLGAVIVSHDLNDLKQNCDRIAIIEKGKIIQTGSFEEIYKTPCNEYTANITGRWNKVNGSIIDESNTTIGIRPERIKLDSGSFQARIIDKTFGGPFYEYNVKYESEELLIYSSIDKQLGDKVLFTIEEYFTL